MNKRFNMTLLITTLICLVPVIFALLVYDDLPAQIPIHFNQNGTPDNYMPKVMVAFGLPVAFAILNLYLHVRVNQDPKVENASSAIRQITRWTAPLVAVVFIPFSLAISMGAELPIVIVARVLAGFMIILIGNYLPKNRQNYTIGLRLPWTLNDEDNWNKTNHFAGILFVFGGFILLISAFFPGWYVTPILTVVLILIPFLYSYLLSLKKNKLMK